jgi:hypothetical protein
MSMEVFHPVLVVIDCFSRYFLQVMFCKEFDLLEDILVANRSKVNIVPMLRKFYLHDWFMNQTASWNARFKPNFFENPTRRGFGSTFNMLKATDLFRNE